MKKFIHPDVKFFNDEKILIELIINGQSKKFASRIYDNANEIDAESRLPVPLIKVRQFDLDHDGLIDEFNFKISIPIGDYNPSEITNLKVLYFFNYTIDDYHVKNFIMNDSICEINIDTPYGVSYVKTIGEIALKQNQLFPSNQLNEKINSFEYNDIKTQYNKRRIYTYYDYEKIVMPRRSEDFLVIESIIKVPSFQEIIFETPSFSGLKFAYMKYISILLPVLFIGKQILMGIFKSELVFSTKSNNLPRFKNVK